MNPTIYPTAHSETAPFVQVTRAIAQNRKLSFAARGMLTYLLSLPKDWDINLCDLQQECGRDAARRILNELITAGYVVPRQKSHDSKGRISYSGYVVYENPAENPHTKTPCTEKPSTVNQTTGKPSTENAHQQINSLSDTKKEKQSKQTKQGLDGGENLDSDSGEDITIEKPIRESQVIARLLLDFRQWQLSRATILNLVEKHGLQVVRATANYALTAPGIKNRAGLLIKRLEDDPIIPGTQYIQESTDDSSLHEPDAVGEPVSFSFTDQCPDCGKYKDGVAFMRCECQDTKPLTVHPQYDPYWEDTKAELESVLDRASYDTWVRNTGYSWVDNNKLYVTVPNSYIRDTLQHRLYDTIFEIYKDKLAGEAGYIEFQVKRIPELEVA